MPQTSDELVNEYMDYVCTDADAPFVEPTPTSTKKPVKRQRALSGQSETLFEQRVVPTETVTIPNQMEYPFEMREGLRVIYDVGDKEFTVAMGPKGWGVREGKGAVQHINHATTWKRFRLKDGK